MNARVKCMVLLFLLSLKDFFKCMYKLDKEVYKDYLTSQNDSSRVHVSRAMRKPMFCIWENKYADQLRGDREADQCLCFRYIDSMIPLLSPSEIASL